MFGLEKERKKLFEFDLEKELKGNTSKSQELLKKTELRIQEIKAVLRQGAQTQDFDKLGVLLLGYVALQKVLTKTTRKK